jgi:plastocyanin
MRLFAPVMGWMLFSGAALTAFGQDIHGQLAFSRPLTRQRVVIPTYEVRGVTPRKVADIGSAPADEWQRVVVYLEGKNAPEGRRIVATVNQRGERFVPEMVVVPVGSTVSFPNSDPIFHNVFSLSRVRKFDLGFYPEGQTRLVKFDKPGVVQVYCHLHPDMNAAILVVPNAWHTRPDEKGAFAFSGIPAGTYQMVVWHKSAGFFREEIQVSEGTPTKVSMEIPLEFNEPKP